MLANLVMSSSQLRADDFSQILPFYVQYAGKKANELIFTRRPSEAEISISPRFLILYIEFVFFIHLQLLMMKIKHLLLLQIIVILGQTSVFGKLKACIFHPLLQHSKLANTSLLFNGLFKKLIAFMLITICVHWLRRSDRLH